MIGGEVPFYVKTWPIQFLKQMITLFFNEKIAVFSIHVYIHTISYKLKPYQIKIIRLIKTRNESITIRRQNTVQRLLRWKSGNQN